MAKTVTKKVAKTALKKTAKKDAMKVSPSPSAAQASTKQPAKKFLGMPGSWRWPGMSAILWNMWDISAQARLFPPKVWGYGWSLNFAYPLNKKNALWKRFLAFLLGLVTILLLVWLLVCVAVVIYYMIEAKFFPADNVMYLTVD